MVTPSLAHGFKEIWAHKFRSALTMSGIVLGVCALVGMLGVIEGLIQNMKAFTDTRGGWEKFSVVDETVPEEQREIRFLSPGRTYRDVEAIRQTAPLVTHVAPRMNLWWAHAQYGNRREWGRLFGVTPEQQDVARYEVSEGRFIGDLDSEYFHSVCVIGSDIANALFPGRSGIGERIQLRGQLFTVVGVLRHYEAMQGGENTLRWRNRSVFIPIGTAIKRFAGHDRLDQLDLQVARLDDLPAGMEQVENIILATHRGILDFRVVNQIEELQAIADTYRRMRIGLGSVAAVSLLVGGLGITSIMLASVNERIREVGIRRAVGARGGDIFLQFLSEALLLSVVGGILGVAAGVGLIQVLTPLLPETPPVLLPKAMLLGLVFSAGLGFLAGIYPALRASRLDPMEALRYE
ncbi:MAG: ABC transporter permease [Puniceicoccaceae bacterium]|nr:MAG: ABC transporter permease [Puniceicoccaceae bacterium]